MPSNNLKKSFVVASASMLLVTGCASQHGTQTPADPKAALNAKASEGARLTLIPFDAPLEGGIVTTTDVPTETTGPSRVIDTTTGPVTDAKTGKTKRGVIKEEEKFVTEQTTISTVQPEVVYGGANTQGGSNFDERLLVTLEKPATKKDIQEKKVRLHSTMTAPKASTIAGVFSGVMFGLRQGTGMYLDIMEAKAADKRVYDENTVIQQGASATQVQKTGAVTQTGGATNVKTGDVKVEGTKVTTIQKGGDQVNVQKTGDTNLTAVQKTGDTKVGVGVAVEQNNVQKTQVEQKAIQQTQVEQKAIQQQEANPVMKTGPVIQQQQANPVMQQEQGQGQQQQVKPTTQGHGGCQREDQQCSIPTRNQIHVLPNGMKVKFDAPKFVIA